MRNPAYKASSGLMDVTLNYSELKNGFEKIIKSIFNSSSEKPNHKSIKIIDTFFSDTFPPHLLKEVFQKAKKFGFHIQIILLNPNSLSAIEREKHLEGHSRIHHLNLGLSFIKDALKGTDNSSRLSSKRLNDSSFLFNQLDELYKLIKNDNHNIQLKFNTQKGFPLYVFETYACLGNFLDFSTARDTPWCFWVNDPLQKNDQYDNLIKHFDTHWDNSYELNSKNLKTFHRKNKITPLTREHNRVFLSYSSHDKKLRDQIRRISKLMNIDIVDYTTEFSGKNNEPRLQVRLDNMFDRSSASIVLLTANPKLSKDLKIPKPNVLIELGRALVEHSPNVLIIKDPNLDKIGNLDGIIYENLIQKGEQFEINQDALYNFFTGVKNISQ